jgi:hypothetical protein
MYEVKAKAVGLSALKVVKKFWMRFGSALGDLQARILLAVLFFLVITPIGLLWRLLGKDPLAIGRSNNESLSYWKAPEKNKPEHWQRMF